MQYKLFHNPRCSKSRQAKKLLEEKNISFETILYLVNPLNENELERILINLTTNPKSLVRIKEKHFKELNINLEKLEDEKFVAKLLANNPKLMERPLLTAPNKAIIGRPPENFLAIL